MNLRRGFDAAAAAWAAALPLATWIASRSHPAAALYAFSFGVYGLGAWICHQRPERSFYLWATQMPVCARCTGIYLGAAIAALLFYSDRLAAPLTRRAAHVRSIVALAALPTLLTLAFEWTTGVAPSNAVRALAGLPMGAAVAWMVRQAEVN
jgi:uncharacterized membrane protein